MRNKFTFSNILYKVKSYSFCQRGISYKISKVHHENNIVFRSVEGIVSYVDNYLCRKQHTDNKT
jgi:hypothetical protein